MARSHELTMTTTTTERPRPQVGDIVIVGRTVPVREGYYGVQSTPAVVEKVNRVTFDVRLENGCVLRYRMADFGWVVRPHYPKED